MMVIYNFVIFFFLVRMSIRKKVYVFVRVRFIDDFVYEVIRYGDDNKVSVMRLFLFVGFFCVISL